MTQYYVSTTGSDLNGGTSSVNAWATIPHADTFLKPGDIVNVIPGAYTTVGTIVTSSSGTTANPIIWTTGITQPWLNPGPAHNAVLTGTQTYSSPLTAIWLSKGNCVQILGFELTGALIPTGLDTEGSFCRLNYNYVHNLGTSVPADQPGAGIFDRGPVGATENEIAYNFLNVIGIQTTVGQYTHALYPSGSYDFIHHNICANACGWGIHSLGDGMNYQYGNGQASNHHQTISNNLCFSNGEGGLAFASGDTTIADYAFVTNNIFAYNGKSGGRGYGIFEYVGLTGPHSIYSRNVCYGNLNGGAYASLGTFTANLFTQPIFVAFTTAGTGDYHESNFSPTFGAGTGALPSWFPPQYGWTVDFEGNPYPLNNRYDIGPYEYNIYYYVSAVSGSDSWPGTQAQPFKTVSHALSVVNTTAIWPKGVIVSLMAGSYTEPQLTIGAMGTTSGGNVVLTAMSRGSAVIITTNSQYGIILWNSSAVGYTNASSGAGFIEVSNLLLTDGTGKATTGIESALPNTFIHHNTVTHIGSAWLTGDSGGTGILFDNYGLPQVDMNCQVYDNTLYECGPQTTSSAYTTGQAHAIYLTNGGAQCYNNLIVGHLCGVGIHTWHYASRLKIYNNTLINVGFAGVLLGSTSIVNMSSVVANNVVLGVSASTWGDTANSPLVEEGNVSSNLWINNCAYSTAAPSVYRLLNGTLSNPVNSDPHLKNPLPFGGLGADYSLAQWSPCIDGGTYQLAPPTDIAGNLRPSGLTYDIGAYEYLMTTYTGFDPGTFQPWALNLTQDALGTAGVARGMQVTPAAPAALTVVVGIDPYNLDGVCFLPNGAWARIDAALNLSVPANNSGVARTDAVVAQIDPTGINPGVISYITNWTTGWKGNGYGTPSSPNNQLVLALVTVPNGASSIVASNIAQTPLRAGASGVGPVPLQSVVADNSGTTTKTGIFAAFGITLTTNAAANQSSFAIPLSPNQRLVPTGKIGGQAEEGFFAGANGWYVPRLVGSVSGTLPIASVDYVNGNINTVVGVQAGEVVTACYKYYDFSNDTAEWSGLKFLERDSPYIVYQADARAGTAHRSFDMWDGVRNGTILGAGENVIITFIGGAVLPYFESAAGCTFGVTLNGAAQASLTLNNVTDVPPYSTGSSYTIGNDFSINQIAFALQTGYSEFGGARVGMNAPTVPAYVFDGGGGVVGGFPVYASNTSINFSSFVDANGATGVVYMDRYGNVTASMAAQALGEMYNGRFGIAAALQYGGATNASTWYGTVALPNQPGGQRPVVMAGHYAYATQTGANNHAWQITADAGSPYGAYLTSGTFADALAITAAGSGVDVTLMAVSNVPLTIYVGSVGLGSITSYATTVVTSANHRVHLTLCSNLPPQTLNVVIKVNNTVPNPVCNFEEVAIRVPAVPPVPNETMPLSYLYLTSGNTIRRNNWLRQQLQVGEMIAGQTTAIASPVHLAGGANLWMANTTSGSWIGSNVMSYTAGRLAFIGGPSCGIATVQVGNQTGTVDCYLAGSSVITTTWFSGANGSCFFKIWSTGTKNPSASGYNLYPIGIDVVEYPLLTIDARQQPMDGVHPAIRGSGLLGSHGEAVGDVTYGVSTAHLSDRAVTSRKVALTTARAVSLANANPLPVNPYTDTSGQVTFTVDVPSTIVALFTGQVSVLNGGGQASTQFVLDGVTVGSNVNATNFDTSDIYLPWTMIDQFTVSPGQHTLAVQFTAVNAGGCYLHSGAPRTLSMMAFAL